MRMQTIHLCLKSRALLPLLIILLIPGGIWSQNPTPVLVQDPCLGGIVGRTAGSGLYRIPKQCDVIIMSKTNHDSLKHKMAQCWVITEEQAELLEEEKAAIALRDSFMRVMDDRIVQLDARLTRNNELMGHHHSELIDCQESKTKELKKQRRRTRLFGWGGLALGIGAGIGLGILLTQ